jgi:hypothetical protein
MRATLGMMVSDFHMVATVAKLLICSSGSKRKGQRRAELKLELTLILKIRLMMGAP